MSKSEDIEKEYQEYAYIVSHDLGAPLRHIREFSKLLINAQNHEPSKEEKSYIDFLNKSLDKVEKMQRALLTYSRINTTVDKQQDIDLNTIITSVCSDYEQIIKKKSGTINVKGNAQIYGDYNLLHLLFSHLIDNSLFYKKEQHPLIINIVISIKHNNIIIAFEDNGIGFDPLLNERIFKLFYKINPNENNKCGAGLAFVKKIIQIHGGIIEAFGTPDKGTTFLMTIPLEQSN